MRDHVLPRFVFAALQRPFKVTAGAHQTSGAFLVQDNSSTLVPIYELPLCSYF